MARLFDDGASEYLSRSSAILSTPPFVLSCWFNSDDITIQQILVEIGDNAANNHRYSLVASGAVGGDPIQAIARDTGSSNATTSTGFSAGAWHYALGIWAATDDRRAFIGGGSKGTNATSRTPVGLDTTVIGARADGVNYMSGAIAEAAIWDLSGWFGQIAAAKADLFESFALPALAAGYSPEFFPLGLVSYWKLLRDEDKDYWGGNHMTAFNTPSIATHPSKIIYPSPQFMIAVPSAVPGNAMPMAMHHYRLRRSA